MKTRALWVALATCLLVAADAPPATDQEKIQGPWVMVGREVEGHADDPADFGKQSTILFEGNRILVKMGSMIAELGTVTLDPSQTPKHYNRTYGDGSPRQGIYELEGDTLKVCLAEIGKPRPTQFATKSGDGTSLLTYRRASP